MADKRSARRQEGARQQKIQKKQQWASFALFKHDF